MNIFNYLKRIVMGKKVSVSKVKLENMSKKSLKTFNKKEAQGWIINTSINIEKLIDDIIFIFFKPENSQIFLQYVLNNSIMHFGGKLKVLRAIGIEKETISKLQEISSIRNAFAHTNITHRLTIKTAPTSETTTEVSDIMSVMNSQGKIKNKDPYTFMLTFLKLCKTVEPILKEKITNLSNDKS